MRWSTAPKDLYRKEYRTAWWPKNLGDGRWVWLESYIIYHKGYSSPKYGYDDRTAGFI